MGEGLEESDAIWMEKGASVNNTKIRETHGRRQMSDGGKTERGQNPKTAFYFTH